MIKAGTKVMVRALMIDLCAEIFSFVLVGWALTVMEAQVWT